MTTTCRMTRRLTVVGTALLGSALAAGVIAVATPAQAAGTTTINAGTCRPASTPLLSGDGFTVFGLQSDGNLVARIGGGPVWTSGTAGTNADRMCLQTDGNFVVYKGSSAVWQSQTAGSGTANRLTVQNDGNVVVYTSANKAVWQSATFVDTLVVGGTVQVGQQLTSRNGTYRAAMQSDGNLVVRTASAATWSTGTAGRGTSRAVLQSDGNFVVYAGSTVTWNAKTGGRGTTRVVMQNDGNLVAYKAGTALWSSKTGTIATDHVSQAAAVARALLAKWGGSVAGDQGVYNDLVAASQSRGVSACGGSVNLDVRMLEVLQKAAARYNVNLSTIVSGHDCDSGWHPKGMAFDVQRFSDPQTGQSSELDGGAPSLDGAFLRYLTTVVPQYAGFGQAYCNGRAGTPMPATVSFFDDTCNHQHVDVTDLSPF